MMYPIFTEIESLHKGVVDTVTRAFPPYCDLQFSNLLSWSSVKHPTKISFLDGNIIAEMKEYDTDRVITMFMGKNEVVKSVREILKTRPLLERVPEEVVDMLSNSQEKETFDIVEDVSNHDYIVRLDNIIELKGRKYKSKRKNVAVFEKFYSTHRVKEIDPFDTNTVPLLKNFFSEVAREKETGFEALADEFEAVERLLKNAKLLDINILAVIYDGQIVGFTINEILHESPYKTALGCFGKSLRRYEGLSSYMEFVTAHSLLNRGLDYINLEEDMGFSGLRQSKSLWRPEKMLKKYVVKLRC